MNSYIVLGINHKFAPLEVRERLAYPERRVPAALRGLKDAARCNEATVISTCNRVEVYAYGELEGSKGRILETLAGDHNLQPDFLEKYCYFHHDRAAIEHLMRVAGGIDSLVLGETQIMNQVKRAYLLAQSENATGKALNGLFHRAFAVAKRLRSETSISEGQLSVSSVAVKFMRRVFEDLSDKTALLIGAGEVGELTLSYLRDQGIGRVVVASRTLERAKALADRFSGDAVPIELLEDYLGSAHIVVSQTSSEVPILDAATVKRIQKKRKYASTFMLDLAVPRDIAPDAGDIDGVYLYNVDDLEQVIAEHALARSRELERCQQIIREESEGYLKSMSRNAAGPLISELRDSARIVRAAEIKRLIGKTPGLNEEQRKEIEAFSERLINKLLHPQIRAIQNAATSDDPANLARLAEDFGVSSRLPIADATAVETELEQAPETAEAANKKADD